MSNQVHVDSVRSFVRNFFDDQKQDAASSYSESILLRDDHYCGRRFICGKQSAVWFVEESQVKFYDEQGRLLEVVDQVPPRIAGLESHELQSEIRAA